MTAIHLINRLYSTTIRLKSPIEVMENPTPTMRLKNGLIPRVFGCVTYVYTHSMVVDKLSPKAVNAMFVGYSNTQKGYHYYQPSSWKILLTKDVLFDE